MATTMTTACGSEGAPIPRATYRNAPANRVSEIVDGTLYVNPRLDPLRTLARSRPGAGLSHAYWFGRGGGPREWWIMFEPQLRLGADILVRTGQAGAGSRWRSCLTRPSSPSRRIGCARCSRPRRASSTCTAHGQALRRHLNRSC